MTAFFLPQRHPESAIAMSSHAQENAKSVERGAIQPQLMRRLLALSPEIRGPSSAQADGTSGTTHEHYGDRKEDGDAHHGLTKGRLLVFCGDDGKGLRQQGTKT